MAFKSIVMNRGYAFKTVASATSAATKTVKPAYTKAAPSSYYKTATSKTYTSPSPSPLSSSESLSDTSATATRETPGVSTADSYPRGKTLENTLHGTSLGDLAHDHTATAHVDWTTSYFGLGSRPFSATVQAALAQPLEAQDIEVKPDGLIYLPEIKYRRVLNRTFGAGGWGLVPRSETIVTEKLLTREYGLVCHGQLVGVARGEQDYFSPDGIPTATEGCKSNALMRCCKDLGIGSELWDPVFIKSFKKKYCDEKFVEHVVNKKKKKIWIRKDREVEYPWK